MASEVRRKATAARARPIIPDEIGWAMAETTRLALLQPDALPDRASSTTGSSADAQRLAIYPAPIAALESLPEPITREAAERLFAPIAHATARSVSEG